MNEIENLGRVLGQIFDNDETTKNPTDFELIEFRRQTNIHKFENYVMSLTIVGAIALLCALAYGMFT